MLVFARAPRPGRTKTRLIPALGAAGAARLHQRMLAHAVQTASAAELGPVTLCCAPHTSHAVFAALAERSGCGLARQSGGDLGQRMSHALREALRGSPSVLLIGSDCPALGAGDLQAAARLLGEGNDVVLGPALDGGYVLVGLTRPQPALFRGVEWGTAAVLEQSRDRLRRAGLRWAELDPRADIDEPEDLAALPPGWLPEQGADG